MTEKNEKQAEREAFEAWAKGEVDSLKKGNNGGYLYADATLAWKAWQASATLVPAAPVAQGLTESMRSALIAAICEHTDSSKSWAEGIIRQALAQSAPRADHSGEGAEMVARKCTRCEYIGRCDCELAPEPSASAGQAEKSLAAIDKALRGKVNDPDPLPKLHAHTAAGEPTTYGLVTGLLRERDALLAKVGKFDQRIVDLGVLAMEAAAPAVPAPSASPICTCPSGDGSLRHPCPSHPSASPEPYNAYQRDWEKVVRWVKVQSETFPELASMSPEGAISWLVVELAARHEKFAEPSASPAALTDVDAVMTKIQEFASTWAVVGGRFDDGTAMECAEECKAEIRALLMSATPPAAEGEGS